MPRRNSRRSWEREDLRTLKAMARQRKGVNAIARKLGRTPGATRQKAFEQGISLETRYGALQKAA